MLMLAPFVQPPENHHAYDLNNDKSHAVSVTEKVADLCKWNLVSV